MVYVTSSQLLLPGALSGRNFQQTRRLQRLLSVSEEPYSSGTEVTLTHIAVTEAAYVQQIFYLLLVLLGYALWRVFVMPFLPLHHQYVLSSLSLPPLVYLSLSPISVIPCYQLLQLYSILSFVRIPVQEMQTRRHAGDDRHAANVFYLLFL